MFQTEPILVLQGVASAWLTWVVAAVSSMGHAAFFTAVIGFVLLAVDLRRGFALAQIVLWTNLITDVAKWTFGLPRPTDVDTAVIDPRSGRPAETPWSGRGAQGFLTPLDDDVLAWFRARPSRSYGFPSGHTSTTTALWGALTILFERRLLIAAAVIVVPAMAFARMYLGRHFLADVLGGALLGAVLVLAGRALLVGPAAPVPLLRPERLLSTSGWRRAPAALWLVAAPAALLLLGGVIDRQRVGYLLGLNVAYLALAARGVPVEARGWPRALARVVLGATLGAASWLAIGWLARLAEAPAPAAAGQVAGGAATTFLLLWGTVTVGRRIGLYVEADLTPGREVAARESAAGRA